MYSLSPEDTAPHVYRRGSRAHRGILRLLPQFHLTATQHSFVHDRDELLRYLLHTHSAATAVDSVLPTSLLAKDLLPSLIRGYHTCDWDTQHLTALALLASDRHANVDWSYVPDPPLMSWSFDFVPETGIHTTWVHSMMSAYDISQDQLMWNETVLHLLHYLLLGQQVGVDSWLRTCDEYMLRMLIMCPQVWRLSDSQINKTIVIMAYAAQRYVLTSRSFSDTLCITTQAIIESYTIHMAERSGQATCADNKPSPMSYNASVHDNRECFHNVGELKIISKNMTLFILFSCLATFFL